MSKLSTREEQFQQAFTNSETLGPALAPRLQAYLEYSRQIIPHLESAYDKLIARISTGDHAAAAPGVGDPFPPFLLTDPDGHLIGPDRYLTNGPLVVSFNRGPWCDYCGLQLRALSEIYPDIQKRGGDVVSIIPETSEFAELMQTKHNLPFDILSDIDFSYALDLGLVFWIGEELRGHYEALGIDLPRFQNHDGWLLPVPGTFIVDRDGIVRSKFVDPDFRNRMELDEIIAAVDACVEK